MENSKLVDTIKLDNCSEELGEKFLNYLTSNYITYSFIEAPTFTWNNKIHNMESISVVNFSKFVDILKTRGADEIFLCRLGQEYQEDGAVTYKIRFCENKDILINNLLELTKLFSILDSLFKETINPAKLKLYIENQTDYNEYEVSEIMKLIRLFCVNKDKN